MLVSPLLARLDIHGELSGLQPAPLEVNTYLLFAIAYDREEDHVHKVLKPSLEEGP